MPLKYSYNARIRALPKGRERKDAMKAWLKQYRKDRVLQRIRNLGRVPICPICQDPVFKEQRKNKQVVFCEADTRHQCHYECWRDWARQTYAETTCPMCRHPYTDLNLKMEVMKRAGNSEVIAEAKVDPELLRMDDHGGWALGFSQPYGYEYNTFRIEVRTDDEYDASKDFDNWELSDFKHVHYSLSMLSVEGSSASSEHVLDGQEFSNIQKLLAWARRRKSALVQLGMPEDWATEMLGNVYTTLKANVGRPDVLSQFLNNSGIEANIAPFDQINFWVMGCLPPRSMRRVPENKVVRVIGTVVDVQGNPKRFVLETRSGKPFTYCLNQLTNKVTLQADNAKCSTLDGKDMPSYNAFKINMGFCKESFRSSNQLETFHLGAVSNDSSESGSSNPWLASDWWPLVPRTMVTLVFEGGSEGYYAQNEAMPDSDSDSDSDSSDLFDDDNDDGEEEEEEEDK